MDIEKELSSTDEMLAESLSILTEYQLKLKNFVKNNSIPKRTNADIINDIFIYIIQTLEVLKILLQRDNPKYKQSAVLLRSIFEYSVRAAWASRMENGWLKYQVYSALEELITVRKAKQDEALKESAEFKEKNLIEIIAQSGVDEKSAMPRSISQILDEIWKKDIEEGFIREDQKEYGHFIYNIIYRYLSPYVHGNTFIFQNPESALLVHIGGVAAQTAFYICYALLYSTIESPEEEIEVLGKKIIQIFLREKT
jgi:hypothetical protein